MTALLAVHAAATWFMVGLIWIIQVVHYPLFHSVGAGHFVAYEAGHTQRMGIVLAIPAAVEVVTAAMLFTSDPSATTLAAGALLAALWLMTLRVQVPLHRRLSRGYDAVVTARLISTNWWRTAGWSLRGAAAVALLLIA